MPKQLEQIADGVWGAQTTVGIGLGAHLPLRMTVLQDDTGLVLVSPIRMDDALAAEIDNVGKVHTIVAPNLLHHMYLGAAHERYPDAKLLGVPGLAEKRTDLKFGGVIDTGELTPGIDCHRVLGAEKLSEMALWHRVSKTLVVADAIFNIPQASGMSWFMLKVVSGVLGRFEQSKFIRFVTNDREATSRSVHAILEWPIERVVMAHGDVVDQDAAARLKAGLWWWRGVPQGT